MVKVGNPNGEEAVVRREIPEGFPEKVKKLIRELIEDLTARGFSVRAKAYGATIMTLDYQDREFRRRVELRLAECGIYQWIPFERFSDYALTAAVGSVSFEYFPDSGMFRVEGDIPVALAASEKSYDFIRDWFGIHHVRVDQLHFHQWYGLPAVHIHIERNVFTRSIEDVTAVISEVFYLIWASRNISFKMLQPKTHARPTR
jgi:hypothetical protein